MKQIEYWICTDSFPPSRKRSHVTCSLPVALCIFSYCSLFALCRHCSVPDTTNTAVYMTYRTNTRWWCCNIPKRAPAGSVSEARDWPSATGWLQARRHWARPRDRQRPIHSSLSLSLSLSLYVSFAVGHNSMAFLISLNIKREEKPTGGLYPHLLSYLKEKINFIFLNITHRLLGYGVV